MLLGLHISRPFASPPPYSLISSAYQRNLPKPHIPTKGQDSSWKILFITSGSSLPRPREKYLSVAKAAHSCNMWQDDSESFPWYSTSKVQSYLFRMPISCLNKPIWILFRLIYIVFLQKRKKDKASYTVISVTKSNNLHRVYRTDQTSPSKQRKLRVSMTAKCTRALTRVVTHHCLKAKTAEKHQRSRKLNRVSRDGHLTLNTAPGM